MAWAISSALQRAYSEASCQPTALAVIQLQPTARIRINDSAAIAGSGATFRFQIQVTAALVEGVDWNATSGDTNATLLSLYNAITAWADTNAVRTIAAIALNFLSFQWLSKRRSSFAPDQTVSVFSVTCDADPSDLLITFPSASAATLHVLDTAALDGSGATVSVVFAERFDLVEAVDFDAGVSPSDCADNLGAAFQSAGSALDWPVPLRYYIDTTASGSAWLTLIWVEDPLPLNSDPSRIDISSGDAPGGSITAYDNSLVPTLRLTYADRPLGSPTAPALISKISGLEDKHDPITREPMLDGFEIGVILDDEMTALFQRYVLKRRRCRLYIGELHVDGDDVTIDPSSGLSNYFAWPMGYIDRVPKSANREATFKVMPRLLDARDAQITRRFTNVHPLEAFLAIASAAAVDVGEFYPTDPDVDLDGLDPGNAAWVGIGHYVVSRYDDQQYGISSGIDQPTSALELLNSLLVVLYATVSFEPGSGQVGLAPFDPDGMSIATLTERASTTETTYPVQLDGDIDDIYDGAASTVLVNFGQDHNSGSGRLTYEEADRAAELELGGRGGFLTIDTDWCNAHANIVRAYIQSSTPDPDPLDPTPETPSPTTAIASDTLSYLVRYAARQGFCGTRGGDPGRPDGSGRTDVDPGNGVVARPTWATLSTGRRAFHRIEGPNYYLDAGTIVDTLGPEVIAIASSGNQSGADHGTTTTEDDVAAETDHSFPSANRFAIDPTYLLEGFNFGRAGLGTSMPFWWYCLAEANGLRVTDITIPKAIAQRTIQRVRLGMPRVTVRGQLDLVQFRPGDIVQLVTDRFIGPLVGRAETLRIYFEVVRNVFRGFDGDPGCQLELALLRTESSVLQATATPIPFYTPTTIVNVAAPNDVVTNDGIPVYADTDGDLVADDQVTVG